MLEPRLGKGALWFDSFKRPPLVSDHSVFAFLVVAYGRFDCIRLRAVSFLWSHSCSWARVRGRRRARPKCNSILISLSICRYEVLYHESCAVGCPTGLPESGTNVGLLGQHVVRDLSPYTMYNFRIRVYNTLYSSLSDEQAVRTQASGMVIAQLLIWVSPS